MVRKIISKIKALVKIIYYNICPNSNIIVFESVPDLSDNTRAVFDEMVRRGLNKKYKMVWSVKGNPEDYPKIPNVLYFNLSNKAIGKKYANILVRAKCLICCNGFLRSVRTSQKSFYLTHGTSVKSVRDYYNVPKEISYILASGQGAIDLQAYELNAEKERFFALGFPRNDILTAPKKNLNEIFNGDFEKVVVWYPTFRQHKGGTKLANGNALPIIYDVESARKLNDYARENKVLVVLKPHFAQDISYIKDCGLSNIRFIDDNFFVNNGISSYEFVGSCDALITDYSSVYFDFLLCEKPIAAVWEDLEEYKKNPGLIDNIDYYMSGAEKVYNIDELVGFIQRVGAGEDLLAQQRREICELINYSTDGQNSQRVVDFIVEKARL